MRCVPIVYMKASTLHFSTWRIKAYSNWYIPHPPLLVAFSAEPSIRCVQNMQLESDSESVSIFSKAKTSYGVSQWFSVAVIYGIVVFKSARRIAGAHLSCKYDKVKIFACSLDCP